MNLWLDAIAAASVALSGGLLGYLFSRLPKPYWAMGYFIPLALLLIYRIAGHYPAWFFTPPISWMMMGRKRFAILGFIAAMILTVPLCRLPRKRDRVAVILLMAMIILSMSIWPFLAPAFNRNQLLRLQTRMGADGVCRQNTDYTCGPAAAVTALRKLGLPADEGPIAVLSYTSAATGTPPDILAEALREQYGKDGLLAEYRAFRDLSELELSDLVPLVLLEERVLWGTDWPHPCTTPPPGGQRTDVTPLLQIDDGRLLNQLAVWAPDPVVRQKILVDNPARLYDF